MLQMLITGGYTMIALFVCSILILAIIIEKSILLRGKKVVPRDLLDSVNNKSANDAVIMHLCNSYNSPFSNIVRTTMDNRNLEKDSNQEITKLEGKTQIKRMERGLVILEVVAAVAPLLGLLGTVLGLVDVFHVVAKLGVGQTGAFSSGIAKALITTVVGLIIAIPALVAYRYFSKKVDSMALQMEKGAMNLINRLYGGKKSEAYSV